MIITNLFFLVAGGSEMESEKLLVSGKVPNLLEASEA